MAESGPELPVLPEYRWTGGVLYYVINHSASSTPRTASSVQFTAAIPTQDIVIFLEECSHRIELYSVWGRVCDGWMVLVMEVYDMKNQLDPYQVPMS